MRACINWYAVAIDMSPSQNALIDLKIAAINHVEHAEFVELIGLRDASPESRLATYDRIREHVPSYARDYWDSQRALIGSGIAYSGKLERFFRGFAVGPLLEHVTREQIEHIWSQPDVATQAAAVDASPLVSDAFRAAFVKYFGREAIQSEGRDPAQFKYVNKGDVGGYFYDRFLYTMRNVQLRGNPYMEIFLTTTQRDLSLSVPYLKPENYSRLRSLLPRITVVTDTIEGYLAKFPAGKFNKANLSDIFEYMSEDAGDALSTALAKHFRIGGRLAFWNLLAPREPSVGLRGILKPHRELATKLWNGDRAFFYSAFHVEEIISH
eukprot:Opistho-2@81131